MLLYRGHTAQSYLNGWSTTANSYTVTRAIGGYEGQACYCIEPGVSQQTGDTLTKKDENFWDNYPDDYNSAIAPYTIKLFIGRIMMYGYTGNLSTGWRSNNSGADSLCNLIATQLLIWESVVGERDDNFNKLSSPAEIENHVPLQPHCGEREDTFHHSQLHEDVRGFGVKL